MASPSIHARRILEQFDSLRLEGELFYNPTRPIIVDDAGLKFEFRVVPSFTAKPQLAAAGEQAKTAQSARRPPPSDGSDIDHSDPAFFVAFVSNALQQQTHKLILNKFCVFRPQFLLLTTDASQRQTSPLTHDDLHVASQVLEELKAPRPHYVIFNCGREGGSSRAHKHMQVLERPTPEDGARNLLWPGVDAAVTPGDSSAAVGSKILPLPYVVFYEQLDPLSPTAARDVCRAYDEHVVGCARALGVAEGDIGSARSEGRIPHNVVMTRETLLTIPRRSATADGIMGHVVNAPGMLGLAWCSNESQLQGWKSTGPIEVLKLLGVPTSSL